VSTQPLMPKTGASAKRSAPATLPTSRKDSDWAHDQVCTGLLC
jgi:hypothetical protein